VDLFSMEYTLGVLAFGAVFFLLQILMDFNKKKEEIRPQMADALRFRNEHAEEIQKVDHLIETMEKEDAEFQKQLDELETKEEELKAKIASADEAGSEERRPKLGDRG